MIGQASEAWSVLAMSARWTHPSVRFLLEKGDPESVIAEYARGLVFAAVEAGWSGPPYDPIRLADLSGIDVEANPDVVDARTSLAENGRLLVEFNPNQPRGRRRYSVAHEIAHTLFPDVAENIRHRSATAPDREDAWQLELLCNIAAAEILMPVGSLPQDADTGSGIDQILSLRSKFDVSVEAIALRLVKLARRPVAAFAASRAPASGKYQLDYLVTSPGWGSLPRPSLIPDDSVISQCIAIGFTAKGTESWVGNSTVRVELVGIPPYPGHRLPRVVGVIWPTTEDELAATRVLHVRGSATEPRGSGPKVVIQIVNDRTPRWGGGFALEISRKWPQVQKDFVEWVEEDRHRLHLGAARIAPVTSDLAVASIVAQHGYGPAAKPRIWYQALEEGLRLVAAYATEGVASVHGPRLGAGQAGGSWTVVEGLLEEVMGAQGVPVTIYTLPGAGEFATSIPPAAEQLPLIG